MIASADWWTRRVAFALVRAYQKAIAPLFPPSCRFVPSCSNYALEALQRKPLPRALWLILRRLCRCHPYSRGGFDPVPPEGDVAPLGAGRHGNG